MVGDMKISQIELAERACWALFQDDSVHLSISDLDLAVKQAISVALSSSNKGQAIMIAAMRRRQEREYVK